MTVSSVTPTFFCANVDQSVDPAWLKRLYYIDILLFISFNYPDNFDEICHQEAAIQATNEGVDSFLTKPFDSQELRAKIHKISVRKRL